MIDPLQRRASVGEKPDYACLLTFAGVPYTQDAAHLESVDVAIEATVAQVIPTGVGFTALAADRIIREVLGGIALRHRRQTTGQPNDKEER